MARVQLKKVAKIYDDNYKAVKNIDLDIKDEEFIVLVGPSGCGKSTTLRMIAGLESISEGELYIGDELVNNIPTRERDIAMVFQSYALYPHMNIFKNIEFGLKISGVPKNERKQRVNEVAEILQLTDHLKKKPGELSGGQRQRVALGRAMVRNPKVFLLDEPLSNLDAKLRVTMRAEIVDLHEQLKTTFIYVTHDQTEAMTMGDRIAVINEGRIEQFDTPGNLYENPENIFVALFIGSPQMNVLNGQLIESPDGPAIQIADEVFVLNEDYQRRLKVSPDNREVSIGLRPDALYRVKEKNGNNVLTAKTKTVEQVGSDTYVYFDFDAADHGCVARLYPAEYVPKNAEIFIGFDMNKIHIFDKISGITLLEPGQAQTMPPQSL